MQDRSLTTIVLLLLLGALLFGCGSESTPSAAQLTTPAAEPQTEVSVPGTPATEAAEPEVVVPDAPADVKIVATVNGRPIARETFDNAKDSILNQYQQIYAQFGMDIRSLLFGAQGRVFELSIEVEAIERAFITALVEEEAERRGIVITSEEADAEFERQYALFLASQQSTEEQLALYLLSQGMSILDFKENGRQSVEAQMLVEAVQLAISGVIDLSDDEIATYFEENRTDYDREERVQASHILVETAGEAQSLLLDLSAGADFAEMAGLHSIDTGSGARGGDLGWFGRGQMVPPFEEVAFSLEVGQLSEPVESEFGFHIILLTGREEAAHPELDEVLEQVRFDAEAEIIGERSQAWYESARSAASVTVTLPLIDAAMKQQKDIDLGLAAFEQIRDRGLDDDPYLSFIIGSIYETKLDEAIAEKTSLEEAGADDPETADAIAALELAIESAHASALAAYQEALEKAEDTADIDARIQALEARLSAEEEAAAP